MDKQQRPLAVRAEANTLFLYKQGDAWQGVRTTSPVVVVIWRGPDPIVLELTLGGGGRLGEVD